ncbi:MAG: shikimate kinase [Planctomycetota bacterium]
MAKVLPNSDAVLARVGARVRARRQGRSWTLRALAEHTGLSPRFLAQLEGGQGNIAIGRLEVVARALGVSLASLVAEEPEGAGELLTQVRDLLTERSPAELRRCLTALRAALERRPRFVALLGLRGAGKSTLGRRAADALGLELVELDERIEAAAGLSLGEIFALHGEPYYRRLERGCLKSLIEDDRPCVVALSGGVVSNPEAFELVLRHATTVWLRAAPEDHMARVLEQGDRRPMADREDAMAEMRALLEAREPLYRQAELAIDTSAAGEEALGLLIAALAGAGWAAPAGRASD